MISILVCTFAACNVNDPSEHDSDADGVGEVTVESITELFGEDNNAQVWFCSDHFFNCKINK